MGVNVTLTKEQHERRAHGIGASEAASVLGLSPWEGPADVWMRKATPTRGPIIGPSAETGRQEAGNALEDGMRAWYARRTGLDVQPSPGTLVHPKHEIVLATPDALVGADGLAQFKLVSSHVADHWAEGVPEYVRIQVAQEMAVSERAWCDVFALVDGEPYLERTFRDLELEEAILEAEVAWWLAHVIGDEAPDPRTDEERRRAWTRLVPAGKQTRQDDSEELEQLIRWLEFGKDAAKAIDVGLDALKGALAERIGEDYGVTGRWGKAIAPSVRGHVDWQAVAEHIAGGPIGDDLAEQFRRAPGRQVRVYPFKPKGAKR